MKTHEIVEAIHREIGWRNAIHSRFTCNGMEIAIDLEDGSKKPFLCALVPIDPSSHDRFVEFMVSEYRRKTPADPITHHHKEI